jgi:protein-ribulosamine 3-kinase
MALPAALKSEIETELGERIAYVEAVAGGCISNASRVTLQNGRNVFLKWGSAADLFHAEAAGLQAIAATNTVRVPAITAVKNWLLLEWLEPGTTNAAQWEQLGRNLAAMHQTRGAEFGWPDANFIGTLPQRNVWTGDWPAFWRDERIAAQAHGMNAQHRQRIDNLLRFCDELEAGNEDGPSLLHGDLWGGNVHGMASGDAALIDPSCYYGHREVDLAMATLFGGFDSRFFDAYNEAWPLRPGFERRRNFYQLYYMLVHVNLFGGAYVSGAMSLVGKLGY